MEVSIVHLSAGLELSLRFILVAVGLIYLTWMVGLFSGSE